MYDVEMTDPRVSHAVHAENGGTRDALDRSMTIAKRAVPANRDPAVHEYNEAEDGTYQHLVNPQCKCGWRMAGFVRRPKAWQMWRRHLGQVSA